ncbi:MAG: hypothetical protein WAX07_04985 [Candidatus Altiarchaeia archaeon]
MAKSYLVVLFIVMWLMVILTTASLITPGHSYISLPGAWGPMKEVSAVELVNASREVETYSFDLIVRTKSSGGLLTQFLNMQVMNITGEVDNINKRTHFSVRTADIFKITPEAYLGENLSYISLSGTGWIRSERRQNLWGTGPINVSIPEADNITVVGTENIGGVECYVLEIKTDKDKAFALLAKQAGIMGLAGAELSDKIKSIESTEWIEKDTMLPRKIVSEIVLSDEQNTVNVEITAHFADYGKPVHIEPPEEAKEYYIEERNMIGLDEMFNSLSMIG